MIDFLKIDYLKDGNDRQRVAYQVLTKHHIFEKLEAFNPILTGTIPINIDIPESDLDISCYWEDETNFTSHLNNYFAKEKNFNLKKVSIDNEATVIANFWIDDFELEVFGQHIPSKLQNAFKHMLIEHQILLEKDESFRQEIVKLKLLGFKTEPAFVQLLGLKGNPYTSLLNYQI